MNEISLALHNTYVPYVDLHGLIIVVEYICVNVTRILIIVPLNNLDNPGNFQTSPREGPGDAGPGPRGGQEPGDPLLRDERPHLLRRQRGL